MATVIDSLVVELGLDPTKFIKGQKEAQESFKQTGDEALKGGKDIEEQAKKSGEALGTIKTQALELFAALGGGAAVIAFATKITTADAAVGRLSRNIGVSVGDISKWQGAARIFGGSAEGMAQSFTAISDAVAGWKIGKISPLIAEFRALSTAGGTIIDVNKGVDQTLVDISSNLKAIHDRDPATAGLMSRAIGLDPGLADLLIQGPDATRAILAQVNALGPATKEAADRAGELAKAWHNVELAIEGKGRTGTSATGPALSLMLNTVAKDLSTSHEVGKGFRETPWGSYWEALKQPFVGKSAAATPSASGAFGSQAEKEAFIRSEAARRGIDPNVAMAVAKSEGFNNPVGDNGTSFGAFQLHLTPGGRGGAVGDQFAKSTGLDVRDPANERAAIQFALDDVKAHGWGAYHGAANSGIGAWAGVDRGAGGSTTSTKIDVNGPITIQAGPNADGAAIANKFTDTLKRQSYAAQANDGQN